MNGRIKALSLWEPWASLVARGEKTVETRSWPTEHRGLLAIHAATKKIDRRWWPKLVRDYWDWTLPNCPDPYAGSRGRILCVVELLDVVATEEIRNRLSADELAFGDYANGRWAWKLRLHHRLFPAPPARGYPGLWTWTDDGGR